MTDAFGVESRTRVVKRAVKSVASRRFSPSYGVHQGLIPDPNWPPTQFPTDSVAMQRKDRRVACALKLELDGRRVEVTGDLSKGGAMLMLPKRLKSNLLTVEVRGVAAQVAIVSVSARGNALAHHGRFVDAAAGARLWKALIAA